MEGGSGLQHATVEVPCLEVAVAVGSGDYLPPRDADPHSLRTFDSRGPALECTLRLTGHIYRMPAECSGPPSSVVAGPRTVETLECMIGVPSILA